MTKSLNASLYEDANRRPASEAATAFDYGSLGGRLRRLRLGESCRVGPGAPNNLNGPPGGGKHQPIPCQPRDRPHASLPADSDMLVNYMSIARIVLLGLIDWVKRCREDCKSLIPKDERPNRYVRERLLN